MAELVFRLPWCGSVLPAEIGGIGRCGWLRPNSRVTDVLLAISNCVKSRTLFESLGFWGFFD
ncbi:hypothetical protein N9U65_04285 [Planctomycetaceae bacterium]|nr:hypothetical protein [Planctomycetaceae bacterium]